MRGGTEYLDNNHQVRNEIQERAQFRNYCTIMLREQGLTQPLEALVNDLSPRRRMKD